MLNTLLKKLIRTGSGRSRNTMAIIGLFIALLLILAAVQIQANYQQILYSKTSQDSIADFLVINKIITNKTIGKATLTPSEINDLKQQPFVEKIGTLTPSRFRVGVQSISQQIPFYSDFFFESVPDEFLDVKHLPGNGMLPAITYLWSSPTCSLTCIILDLHNRRDCRSYPRT